SSDIFCFDQGRHRRGDGNWFCSKGSRRTVARLQFERARFIFQRPVREPLASLMAACVSCELTRRDMTRRTVQRLILISALGVLLPVLVSAADTTVRSSSYEIKMPRGIPRDLWEYFVPRDNPMTSAKVELGRRLFFENKLSADGSVSCSSCHDPRRAFTDGKKVAEGIAGKQGTRNSPTLLNAMFNTGQFWDGRAGSLEAQARLPLINPVEMGNRSLDEVVERLARVPEYKSEFERVFGGPVTIDAISKAIAAFERTLLSGDSPVDRYLAGDLNALNESARNGLMLFRTRARCGICHAFNQNF